MSDKIKPIMASAGGDSFEFELLPAGMYLARCYKMVDVGTQEEIFNVNGKSVRKELRRVHFYWEILKDINTDEPVFMEDGERVFSVSKKYTLSLNSKATLLKDLNSWRTTPFTKEEAASFDVTKVLGKFCQIQVIHNESKDGTKTYANVGSIMAAPKKLTEGVEGVNPLTVFTIDDPDQEVFDSLSEYLQTQVNSSKQLRDRPLIAATKEDAPSKVEEANDDDEGDDADTGGF